ncbi:MAG: hypothetical protein J6K74_01440 [Marinifilaceae bacterium]|nr:hypothetical protein [Marinifilaceae bacterium]
MRASEFPSILPIPGFGYKAGGSSAKVVVPQSPSAQPLDGAAIETSPVKPAEKAETISGNLSGTAKLKELFAKVKEREVSVTSEKVLGNDKFTVEDVKRALIKFGESHSKETELYLELSALSIEVEQETNINLIVDNKYSEQIIMPFLKRIEGAVSESVNNRNILLNLKYVEPVRGAEDDKKSVLITAKDKLEYFIELNPCVAKMVELLGLELE